jgi:hypothetical protein
MQNMADALENFSVQAIEDKELKKQLRQIDWHIKYGSIKIQLRDGEPTLITIERTIKLD